LELDATGSSSVVFNARCRIGSGRFFAAVLGWVVQFLAKKMPGQRTRQFELIHCNQWNHLPEGNSWSGYHWEEDVMPV
jgi:hypothetical protein